MARENEFPFKRNFLFQFLVVIYMETDDLSLTAKTPWGALVTSKGAQILFERFSDDISLLKNKIKRIEVEHSNDSILTELKESNEYKKQVQKLKNRLDKLDQRISDLDARFTQFSTESLQLLHQLTGKMEKIDKKLP